MPTPHGFSYRRLHDDTVLITHQGRSAATLRGPRAEKFLAEAESGDAQPVMARWTGSYTCGNERTARDHPRNRGGRGGQGGRR